MSFFLGIDLGASALKLSLIDAHAQYVGGCSMGLKPTRPNPAIPNKIRQTGAPPCKTGWVDCMPIFQQSFRHCAP